MAVLNGQINHPISYTISGISYSTGEVISYEPDVLHTTSTFISQINIPMPYYQTYLSSFARFFGVNAKQDVSNLYLVKSDLGLTPLSYNNPESILVALLLRIAIYESNPLMSNVYIFLYKRYIEQGVQNFLVSNLVILLYKKINYIASDSEVLNNIMENYNTIVDPDDFSNY